VRIPSKKIECPVSAGEDSYLEKADSNRVREILLLMGERDGRSSNGADDRKGAWSHNREDCLKP